LVFTILIPVAEDEDRDLLSFLDEEDDGEESGSLPEASMTMDLLDG
jgi:hypothetical protein